MYEEKVAQISEAIAHGERLNGSFSECPRCKEIVRDKDKAKHMRKHNRLID